ncbi:MAG: integration host factor subunit beta [Rickettsiaceae bacterium]|nr:integration host factor subunit beta [Rickettsiaceae bacterium]
MATKSDLINKLAKKLDYLSKADITSSVDNIFDYLQEELTKGNRVEIRGFGSLSIRDRKYAGKDEYYKTIYYRMSKNIQDNLK